MEAPKEFDGVASALSSVRREKAENGTPHITARKLGALFQALLPATPSLSKAYGQRASEISQVSSLSTEARKQYGAFSGHAGSDATTIWAAATSGPAALQVHLLACFLARVWDGPEAISIWVEIIRRRKDIVRNDFNRNNMVELSTIEATKQEITRPQIAEWDASARSWLLTADAVKSRQYTQLKLIIDNVKGSVNTITDTYESVMAAWKNSLTQMEGLIDGISQQASNGDILIAISAWHLFPDLRVVNPCSKHVSQHDPIFNARCVLTIGLEGRESLKNGVSWSLPLACLRFYGDPVVKVRSVNSEERSRLSLNEFLQAILGCFLGVWDVQEADCARVIHWLNHLKYILDKAITKGSANAQLLIAGFDQPSWFNLLLSAARASAEATDGERQMLRKLVLLGRRYGKTFLGLPKQPFFGLSHRGAFIGLMKTENERIKHLREVATTAQNFVPLQSHQLMIRYRHSLKAKGKQIFEYATALPLTNASKRRKISESKHQDESHHRWLYAAKTEQDPRGKQGDTYITRAQQYKDKFARAVGARPGRIPNNMQMGRPGTSTPFELLNSEDLAMIEQDYHHRLGTCNVLGESIHSLDEEIFFDSAVDIIGFLWSQEPAHLEPRNDVIEEAAFYTYLYGDLDSAALFIVDRRAFNAEMIRTTKADCQDMISLFESRDVDEDAVVESMYAKLGQGDAATDPHIQSAKGVSTAAKLYQNFPHATIDIRILQHSLYKSG